MILVTASNSKLLACRDLCFASMQRYFVLHPRFNYTASIIPDEYDRRSSWYKLTIIQNLLPLTDYVMWLDADSMIVGTADLLPMIQPVTLNIAKDVNGINAGVMCWRNCPQSFDAIKRAQSLYERFATHVWGEQAALMTFVDELDVAYQPKYIWNAYGDEVAGVHDVCPETLIVHFPGMRPDERVKAMLKVGRGQRETST